MKVKTVDLKALASRIPRMTSTNFHLVVCILTMRMVLPPFDWAHNRRMSYSQLRGPVI